MADIGAPELLIIAAVIMILFGSKRLPDAARSLGRSLRILKSEIKGLDTDDTAAPPAAAPAAVTVAPVAAEPAPAAPPAGAAAR
ncbi:Sec-independent protein translocase subunit TatA [Parafrankia discariae]|uniref:Sec-independent protein translocase subunit TatA n=1 Tax=Parafrankia discariae TaxID=365528 RepID=UPI00036901D6|nr:Sec-independent protein translocase subunit TatA [Parafrankia discariae]